MSEQHEGGMVPDWDRADRLRKALRHAGMTPGQMADYLEVGGNTVSTWINGRIEPRPQTLKLWALRTGVSYAWLVTGNKESVLTPHMKSRYVVWALAS